MNPDRHLRAVRRAVVVVCCAALFGAASFAQSAASAGDDALRARLAELERQVAELRAQLAASRAAGAPPDDARLKEVERKLDVLAEELARMQQGEAAAPAAPAGDAGGTDDATAAARRALGPAAGKVYRGRGVSVGGYGEALYQDFDATRDDGAPSGESAEADQLRAVLYFGYKFSDRFVFNSEIEFEHGGEETAVEFAYVDALLDPRLNVRAGQILVPVGLINEMHEPPTFLGARRPLVERVILPATWSEVGLGVYGDLGPVSYRAYVMPGLDSSGFSAASGIRGGRQAGIESVAADKAFAARVDWTATPGLLAGVSYYRGGSGQDAIVDGRAIDGTVTVADVHADWKWRGLQLRGVVARVEVDDAAAISEQNGEVVGSRMGGWYAEAGYDVLAATRWNRHALIPFARYESFDTQEEVPAGLAKDPANDRELITYGLVYKPLPQLAFKFDYQDARDAAGTGVDQFNAAVGFYF